MKIYIVGSYHGESRDVYHPLLSSMNNQEYIDWNNFTFILSRSDGGNFFPDLTEYPNLKEHTVCISGFFNPQGPSATRQQGIDYAQSLSTDEEDRMIMVDIDDEWTSPASLAYLWDCSNSYKDFDLIIFPLQYFSKETQTFLEPPVPKYQHTEPQSKCYNLKFLRDNDLRFPSTAWTYEDGYWQACLYALPKYTVSWAEHPIYKYVFPDGNATSTSTYIRTHMSVEETLKEWENRYNEFVEWKNRHGISNACEFYNYQSLILKGVIEYKDISSPEIKEKITVYLNRIKNDLQNDINYTQETVDIYQAINSRLPDNIY